MNRCSLLHENDTVGTLLVAANPGDTYVIVNAAGEECGFVTATEQIPFAHKIAVKAMQKGDTVIKMNLTIGLAESDIPLGSYAHVHNISSIEGRRAVK